MNLPLHFCNATNCRELTATGTFLCEKHHRMIGQGHALLLAGARSEKAIAEAERLTLLDIATQEGLVK